MRSITVWTGVATLATHLIATAAWAETVALTAELSGAAQVPPNPSKGTGSVAVTFDTQSRVVTWKGSYAGLTGQPLAAHFHGPAEAKMNAPVVVNFEKLVSPFEGTATLTEAQAAGLLSGQWYVNIHTPSYPGGELRGQVVRAAGK